MIVSDRLRKDPADPSVPALVWPLELPESLQRVFAMVHGADRAKDFEMPFEYMAFLRDNDGGGYTEYEPDGQLTEYGWRVFHWTDVVLATVTAYEDYVFGEDTPEDERELNARNLREAGMWLHVGTRARHDHFLCCDRGRRENGDVIDLNDGHPAYGLVGDIQWPSFHAYVSGGKPYSGSRRPVNAR